jgi:hypothetical protein
MNMAEDKPPTLHVVSVLRDARQEAESAEPQFREVTELLRKEDYVQALGAFDGLEDRVHYIGVVLQRFSRHLGLSR